MGTERILPKVITEIRTWPPAYGPQGPNGKLGIPTKMPSLPNMEKLARDALRQLDLGGLALVEVNGVQFRRKENETVLENQAGTESAL
ncbi:MAG: hypothetical protein HY377_01865 [Candidatus Blackburnbacteria bacterium]|nr:hypothetical protein [Candidatus Blackburnbacteria bacterium]